MTDVTLSDHDLIRKRQRELDLLRAELDRTGGEEQREKRNAEVKLCDSLRPEHSRLAKAFAGKVIELNIAHRAYVDFLDAIEAVGASAGSLRPVFPNALGHPKDHSGGYHWILKEFRENGHIEIDSIPVAVR